MENRDDPDTKAKFHPRPTKKIKRASKGTPVEIDGTIKAAKKIAEPAMMDVRP